VVSQCALAAVARAHTIAAVIEEAILPKNRLKPNLRPTSAGRPSPHIEAGPLEFVQPNARRIRRARHNRKTTCPLFAW
jgi:hypothetical protein